MIARLHPRRARRLGCAVVVATVAFSSATGRAQVFPTPGGAPGSQTGDGGGAFTGVAPAPSANLFTGTSSTSVRIEVPPGRAEMTPSIGLHYSSGLGPSSYGHGWSLPVARVSRSVRHGVPGYDDADVFVLEMADGAMELEAVVGTPRYRARRESAFLRIGFDRGANAWTVVDKGGKTYRFGTRDAARLGIDPTGSDTTAAWLLTRTVDTFGNHIDYHYLAGAPAPGLLERIEYGGNLGAGIGHPFSVVFSYDDLSYPTAAPTAYAGGYESSRDRLLTRVETFAPEGRVRRYGLSHSIDAASGAVHLVGISLDGFAADPAYDVALPSTVFSYAPSIQPNWPIGTPAARAAQALALPSPGSFRDAGSGVSWDLFDIDGDAVVDYVRADLATVRLGNTAGFDAAMPWTWPANARLVRHSDTNGHLELNVFDVTGDGLPDLVDTRTFDCPYNTWCVYRNTGSGFAAEPELWPTPQDNIRTILGSGTEVWIDAIDLNGDARPDWVNARSFSAAHPYWEVHWNTGSGFESSPTSFRAPADVVRLARRQGTTTFQTSGVYDVNGDGLPDFVDADPSRTAEPQERASAYWEVFLNTGYGFEETPRRWSIEGTEGLRLHNYLSETQTWNAGSKTHTELVDLTGDGLPDWIRYWEPDDETAMGLAEPTCEVGACPSSGSQSPPRCCANLLVFVNTGASFSAPTRWRAWDSHRLREYTNDPELGQREWDLIDFDGDGLLDLCEINDGQWHIYRHPASPLADHSQTPPELRARPGLLVSMMNGVGGETHVSYAPASLERTNRLPFPQWTMVGRQIHDGTSGTQAGASGYVYRYGHYDSEDREFRGFSTVWEADAAGRTIETRFHQDDRLRGLTATTRTLGNPQCTATDPFDPADPCSPLAHVLRDDKNHWTSDGAILLASRSSTPYLANEPVSALGKSLSYQYDGFGNVAREIVHSASAGTVATDSAYTYSIHDAASGLPDRYLVDRVVHVITYGMGSSGGPLLEKRYAYDASPPRTGALKQSSTCIDSAAPGCSRWSTTTQQHDRVGNVVRTTGANGATTTFTYDALRLHAVTATNASGHVAMTTRDRRSGRAVATTAPDGQTTVTVYDGISRPMLSWGPGFTVNFPEITGGYREGVPGGAPGLVRSDRAGAAPAAVFYDGVGRVLATKSLLETEEGERTIVSGLRRYGPAGELLAEAVPFEAPNHTLWNLEATIDDAPALTEYFYDADGRLIETRGPDGARTLHDESVPGLRTTTFPNLAGGAHPGKAIIESIDGFGRVWRKDTCSQAPAAGDPTRCPGESLESRTEFVHDGLDRVVAVTTAAHLPSVAATTTTTYDGLGNRSVFDSPDTGRWTYEYTKAGLLKEAVDPRGQMLTNKYDKLGRLRKQKASGVKNSFKFWKRGAGMGRVRRIATKGEAARVRKDIAYDERGQVVREEFRIGADGPTRRHTIAYGYDFAGRRETVSYPGSTPDAVVRTVYTRYGRPHSLLLEEGTETTAIVAGAGYDLYGNLTRLDYGNGRQDRFAYGGPLQRNRLVCLRTGTSLDPQPACGASPFDVRRLAIGARDSAGNVLTIEDRFYPPGDPRRDQREYGYDALGRMVRADYGSGLPHEFAYDGLGNMIFARNQIYTYDPSRPHLPTRADGLLIYHDEAGNRTQKGNWFYHYDALGRLTGISDGTGLRQRNHYDEGGTRVARYDAENRSVRYYFGGLFEIEGDELVRHFHFGGRIVASDFSAAPAGLSLASSASPSSRSAVAAAAAERPTGGRAAAAPLWLAACLLIMIAAACRGDRRQRHARTATVTALAFLLATLPLPRSLSGSAPAGIASAHGGTGQVTLYYHPDRLGSPYLVTDDDGAVVEHRRYGAYGLLRGIFDASGATLESPSSPVSFTGQQRDPISELVYFGSRFYDPSTGMFLTPDPAAQFASPYLYAGGNPVNGTDPDGESIFLVALAVLKPILASATISAFVSGVAAALQGGDFVDGFTSGFVGGLVSAGLGTAIGVGNVGFQYFAGGAQYIEAAEAVSAAIDVAYRAGFTAAVTNTAVTAGQVAGLGSDWLTGIGITIGLLGSYAYDNYVIKDSGAASASHREMAKGDVIEVNTGHGHGNVTMEAAADPSTGYERYGPQLAEANVAQDGPQGPGLRNAFKRAWATLNNQDHFGRLPSTLQDTTKNTKELLQEFGKLPAGEATSNVEIVGGATHFIQDHLTLGHMVPGTSLFATPLGAPIRFVIHQAFGGEVAFRQAQIRATRQFLRQFPLTIQA